MKYNNIFDYVPRFDCSCVQGTLKCFGTGVDVLGIIGILLMLGGVIEIAAGTYFMIVLPIFDSASNIWTGFITAFVGAMYMYYGCTSQTKGKHYTNLSLSLVALITNVANLVIIVVGERGIFLSEEDKLQIDRESKNNLYKIAIWGTASTSCTILLILFMVAQFIFCGYLQINTSNHKGSFQNQKNDRFFPPSRVINSKVPNQIYWNDGMKNESDNFGGGNISTNSDFISMKFKSGHDAGVLNDSMTFATTVQLHANHNSSPKILKTNEAMKFETFKSYKKHKVINTYDNPSFVNVKTTLNNLTDTETIKNATIPPTSIDIKSNPKTLVNTQKTKRKKLSTIKRPTVPPPSPPISKKMFI